MKKFLSFMTFAMLMTATCFTLTACGDDDDDGGNTPKPPTPAQQAKNMIMGIWEDADAPQANHIHTLGQPDAYLYFYDEQYIKFDSEHYYKIFKIKETAPDDMWYSDFKGKYVGYIEYDKYEVQPYDDNIIDAGGILLINGSSVVTTYYSKLTEGSFVWEGKKLVRPTKTIEYEEIPYPFAMG